MKISEMFEGGRQVFSMEVFPPKKEYPVDVIYDTLEELTCLKPDFISVTYGASGTEKDTRTAEIASHIKREMGTEALAHLTCVNSSKEDIESMLDVIKKDGIENILALRGDDEPDAEGPDDFPHASDLVSFIKEREPDIGIAGACYPETHKDSDNQIDDIRNLKMKVDVGADHLISQLFFDNDMFYDFLEKARIAGINVPIEAGIMPVVDARQIVRMVSLCGASLPPKFTKMIQRYEDDPKAVHDAGIAYAIDQIAELLAEGVDGIHLYTMNKPDIAAKINDSVRSLFKK